MSTMSFTYTGQDVETAIAYGNDGTAIGGELINGLRPVTISYPGGRIVNYNYVGDDDSVLPVANRRDRCAFRWPIFE